MKTWAFTSWATDSIRNWVSKYEGLLAEGAFDSDPKLVGMLRHQVQIAKEELTTRLLRETL